MIILGRPYQAGPGPALSGRVVFLCPIQAGERKLFRLYYGRAGAGTGRYDGTLVVRAAAPGPIDGPMHWTIENEFYRVETYPKNGQIWHLWDKRGSNRIWWFKEWNGLEKGGDPVDWSPNAWVAYPDRVNVDPGNLKQKGRVFAQPFDWRYAVGWVAPQTEIISGPLFHQIRRWGPLPPHPEHSAPDYDRPAQPIVWAEVTYRFYAGLPWYYQSSTLKTLADMDVYFIRNGQMVFRDALFTHLAVHPETPGLIPGDRDATCILPLMGHFDRMPFAHPAGGIAVAQGHSLSDVLPSRFGYYSLFNAQTGDGYANFPLAEKDSTASGAEPTMLNHHMSLSEGHDWTVYFARTFDYTNQRFNPENATPLPRGQQFDEENVHLIYRYEGPRSLAELDHWNAVFRHPLTARWSPTADEGIVVWRLENAGPAGGRAATVIGAPRVVREADGASVRFDGEADGWIMPYNPLAGWRSFTVEVLLRPDRAGGPEQRFIHLEDDAGRRLMFETRLTAAGQWALDTFLTDGAHSGMLLDRKLLHAAGQWHWAALVYDQGRMTSFVDGQRQLSTAVAFTPMVSGRVGVGFRMNRVYWYHGDIREIRFHPAALPDDRLARIR